MGRESLVRKEEEMMWSYRVCKDKNQLGTFYSIREVYFYADMKIHSWVAEPCFPIGETYQDLKEDFEHMQRAFKEPVFEIPEEKTTYGAGQRGKIGREHPKEKKEKKKKFVDETVPEHT